MKKTRINEVTYESENIESISLNWLSGEANIYYHEDSKILIQEELDINLDDRYNMQTEIKDKVLTINYNRPNALSGFFNRNKSCKKIISITIPKNLKIKEFNISSVSGNISSEYLNAESIKLKNISGDIIINKINSELLSFSSVSGLFSSDEISSNKTIGNSVSGSVNLKINTGKCQVSCISGNANLIISENVDDVVISSVSGKTNLYLPSDNDFTINKTSNANININDFYTSNKNDKIILGNGGKNINISSVSGAITINKSL